MSIDPPKGIELLGGRVTTDDDVFLFAQGRNVRSYEFLGSHISTTPDQPGVHFAVWAPNALEVSVVGDFNGWSAATDPLKAVGSSGVWEGFVLAAGVGDRYKYAIRTKMGAVLEKADPYARATEAPPLTASVIYGSTYTFTDGDWLSAQRAWPGAEPVSIYEVHLGSINPTWGTDTYKVLAEFLVKRVKRLGFTHVEFMPVTEHPFGGSWGYQATGYFAPSARWGTPAEFAALVDAFHRASIGVILDWVPGHFATDEFGLYRFDGTALYEHEDPRLGIHNDWGSAIFNFGRHEVRSFLLSSANLWVEAFHIDAIRVDAVASMLYLDYSREDWIPNEFGGRENLNAIHFLREFNAEVPALRGGATTYAEESTAFGGMTTPTSSGGLGFGFKWNMGWMHDTLDYFHRDPIHRKWHHNELTFGLLYAYSENFVLPISHDEVVHGKGSLWQKMPGDNWQKWANLRALLVWMWAHPGKKLLFMGCEFGQPYEWQSSEALPLHLGESGPGSELERMITDLNAIYRTEESLHATDVDAAGFTWRVADDRDNSVFAFERFAPDRLSGAPLLCISNLSPVVRGGYDVEVSEGGRWRELLNSDSSFYGGSGVGNLGAVASRAEGGAHLLTLELPPLATLYFTPEV